MFVLELGRKKGGGGNQWRLGTDQATSHHAYLPAAPLGVVIALKGGKALHGVFQVFGAAAPDVLLLPREAQPHLSRPGRVTFVKQSGVTRPESTR